MDQMIYAGMWIAAIWLSVKAWRSEWNRPRGLPDRVDRIATLIFGIATIALPVCAVLLLGTHAPAWIWPFIAVSSAGLSLWAIRASKGLPRI